MRDRYNIYMFLAISFWSSIEMISMIIITLMITKTVEIVLPRMIVVTPMMIYIL